jgi:hypothetical protein
MYMHILVYGEKIIGISWTNQTKHAATSAGILELSSKHSMSMIFKTYLKL